MQVEIKRAFPRGTEIGASNAARGGMDGRGGPMGRVGDRGGYGGGGGYDSYGGRGGGPMPPQPSMGG